MLLQILTLSFIGSIGGLVGGILLALRKKPFTHSQNLLVISFAAGVMLATALLDLLPEAVEIGGELMPGWILAGVVFLFLLEKTLLWYHHHDDDCDDHENNHLNPWLLTIGDTLHNFIDGIVMGAAILINPTVGLVTALAVMAHEIPHEMADFGVMLSSGWSKGKAIFMNIVSAAAAMLGAVLVYYLGTSVEAILPNLLFFAGGMFIYLSCSDLIPELHHVHTHQNKNNSGAQIILFAIGIALISGLIKWLEG